MTNRYGNSGKQTKLWKLISGAVGWEGRIMGFSLSSLILRLVEPSRGILSLSMSGKWGRVQVHALKLLLLTILD